MGRILFDIRRKNRTFKSLVYFCLAFIIALFTNNSMFPMNSYAASSPKTDVYGQKQISALGKPLRLAIPDFEILAGESRFDILQRALPELVAIGLIENPMVKYVDRGRFWANVTKKIKVDEFQNNIALIFKEEFLDELKIDLILRGNFFEYDGKIKIEATLENRRNKKSIKISAGVVDVTDIYSGISQLSKELDAEIRTIARVVKGKNIAILCFTDRSLTPSDRHQELGKNITISLISFLDVEEKVSVLPWSATKRYCGEDELFDHKILAEAGADALIKGNFIIEKDNIELRPVLFISDTGDLIELMPVKGNLAKYSHFENNLIEDVKILLEAIVGDDGSWIIEPLLYADDPEQYVKRGKKYLDPQEENIYLAALMFSRAIQLDRNHHQARYYLGTVRERQGRYEEAMKEFKETIKIKENYAEAHKGLGKIYLELDQPRLGLEEFRKAAKINPDLVDIHFNIAKTYYLLGDYEKTIQEAEAALKHDLNNTQIYVLLARANLSIGSVAQAIETYIKAIKIEPDNPDLRMSLRNLYMEQGRLSARSENFAGALNYFNEVKAIQPSKDAYYWIMNALINLKRFEEQLKIIDEAKNDGMIDTVLLVNKGFALQNLDRDHDAIDAYNQAIELDKTYASSYFLKGRVYMKLGEYDNAVENLSKFLDLEPKDIFGYNERGNAYRFLGKHEKALSDFDYAIKLDPKYSITYSNRGSLYEDFGKHESANNDFNKAIEFAGSNDLFYYLNIAFEYAKFGKYDMAMDNLNMANMLKPSDLFISLRRSELYIIQNNFTKALDDINNLSALVEASDNEAEKIIYAYFECVTKKLLNMDTSSCESELDMLLKKNVSIDWSFELIEAWLGGANISAETKRYISDKTNRIK